MSSLERPIKPIITVESDNRKLVLFYDKMQEGLHQYFSSDARMAEYITKHPKEAFTLAVSKKSNAEYYLNIALVSDFGYIEWEKETMLLERLKVMFCPIVRVFINIMKECSKV